MKKSGVKPHQADEQVSDAKMSRRHLIQGALLSTAAASSLVVAAEPSAYQGGDPKAEVEGIERKLMWLYSNDLPKHVNEIMEYFDDTPEMLQFDVMSPREFKGAAFRKHFNDLAPTFSSSIKVDIMDMQTHANNHLAFVSSLQHCYGMDPNDNLSSLRFASPIASGRPMANGRSCTSTYLSRSTAWKAAKPIFSPSFENGIVPPSSMLIPLYHRPERRELRTMDQRRTRSMPPY